MKIAIVNKRELNSCWSSLQYTNNCHLCDKIKPKKGYLQCKVNSKHHKDGIAKNFEIKQSEIIEAKNNSLKKLILDKERALKIF